MKHRMITIVGWDEFQHYKERDPIWIKNYVRLLRQDEYMDLTPHRRALLHGLWLLYAIKRQALRHHTATLSRELGMRVMTADLEALKQAGFIAFSASKPLAKRYQAARPEKEVEKEVEKTPNGVLPKPRERDVIWDALSEEIGSPSTKTERSRRGKCVAELREASASPAQVHERCARWRAGWPDMTLTDTALVKHWTTLGTLEAHQNGRGVSGAQILREALELERGEREGL